MRTTLDYRIPQTAPPDPDRDVKFRALTVFLALDATLWAVFCSPFIIAGSWREWFIFGPGYVITIGYYWRTFGHPSPNWCRAIWGLSLLVQGAWLGCVVLGMFFGPLGGGMSGVLIVAWWTTATVISLIALLLDPGKPAAN